MGLLGTSPHYGSPLKILFIMVLRRVMHCPRSER
jgi:hypothetical protein